MTTENIEVLKDWLIKQDYWSGVKLYEQYGSSDLLREMFRSNEDDINLSYLISEIKSIVEAAEQQIKESVDQYPKELKHQVDYAKRLMDEKANLKATLRVLYLQNASEDLLKKAAFRMLELNDEILKIYDQERFFKKLGHLPESTDYAVENGEYLLKRLYNLRTYVSRYKDRSDKLQQYQEELFEVEKKLEKLGLIRIEK